MDGVDFGFPELGRLLHNEGTRGYTNDNILDVIGNAINGAEGDFWVFQAHLFEKFTTGRMGWRGGLTGQLKSGKRNLGRSTSHD